MFDLDSFIWGMIAGVIIMTIITSALIAVYRIFVSKDIKTGTQAEHRDGDMYYTDSDIERWR